MADHISLDICSTSSPSSGGVDSHHGTPGTKLTEFSPEECHSEQKSGNSGDGKISLPPAFSIQGVPFKISPEVAEVSAFGIQDPFTTSSSVRIMNHVTSAGIKLSPTAADFTPLQSGRVFSISGVKKAAICSTVSYLNATSVPDCETSHLKLTQNILSVPGSAALTQLPIGQWSSSHPAVTCSSTESTPSETTSAVLHSTRYLKISQVLRITAPKQLNAIFMVGPSPARSCHPLLTSPEPSIFNPEIDSRYRPPNSRYHLCQIRRCTRRSQSLFYARSLPSRLANAIHRD